MKQNQLKTIKMPKNNLNNFLMLLLDDKTYTEELVQLIKRVKDKSENICYVCLSKPYTDVIDNLKNEQINHDNFTFIDIFSSHNYELKDLENCIFVRDSENLEEIGTAVRKAVTNKQCSTIVFDSISTLLIYQKVDSIVKFTYDLLSDKKQKKAHKIYLLMKGMGIYKDESTNLINDLRLFADKVIDVKD